LPATPSTFASVQAPSSGMKPMTPGMPQYAPAPTYMGPNGQPLYPSPGYPAPINGMSYIPPRPGTAPTGTPGKPGYTSLPMANYQLPAGSTISTPGIPATGIKGTYPSPYTYPPVGTLTMSPSGKVISPYPQGTPTGISPTPGAPVGYTYPPSPLTIPQSVAQQGVNGLPNKGGLAAATKGVPTQPVGNVPYKPQTIQAMPQALGTSLPPVMPQALPQTLPAGVASVSKPGMVPSPVLSSLPVPVSGVPASGVKPSPLTGPPPFGMLPQSTLPLPARAVPAGSVPVLPGVGKHTVPSTMRVSASATPAPLQPTMQTTMTAMQTAPQMIMPITTVPTTAPVVGTASPAMPPVASPAVHMAAAIAPATSAGTGNPAANPAVMVKSETIVPAGEKR
jgi:hypothetical protein